VEGEWGEGGRMGRGGAEEVGKGVVDYVGGRGIGGGQRSGGARGGVECRRKGGA